jgi:hypothetical protein
MQGAKAAADSTSSLPGSVICLYFSSALGSCSVPGLKVFLISETFFFDVRVGI